jgi:iron-sulfur cluster insertion protein
MISITAQAQEHLKNIQDAEGKYPKLSVAGGGCAGFKYEWTLVSEDEIDDMSDEVIDLDNSGRLVVCGMSLMYLFGSEISLNKGVFGQHLEIGNPQAQAGCGCGESVGFDMDMVAKNMDTGFNFPDE